MNDFLEMFSELWNFPQLILDKCTFLPECVSLALLKLIYFLPFLIILYIIFAIIEKYFITHIRTLVNSLRNFGALAASLLEIIPGCTYAVISSILYSRNIISRGTLFAALIMCSDEALPLLFIEPAKALAIIPVLVIKFILALAVGFGTDILETILSLRIKRKDDLNSMNLEITEHACCNHMLDTNDSHPKTGKHVFVHTVNIFMFALITFVLFYYLIGISGSAENLADALMINSFISILVVGAIGLISNCAVSVFIAVAYVLGLISFPAFLAGMITVTGLGLFKHYKYSPAKKTNLTTVILYVLAVVTGLAFYFNIFGLNSLAGIFIK